MKSSAAYLVTFLLGATQANTQANTQCVTGQRETIRPGYVVEHKCNLFRQGDVHNGIGSNYECAQLCEAAARSVCSYHPPTKRCVVGRDDGQDVVRTGVTYMEKVHDAPAVDEDPFALDCGQEKDACLARETTLNAELAQCKKTAASSATDSATLKDMLAANCKKSRSCARPRLIFSLQARASTPRRLMYPERRTRSGAPAVSDGTPGCVWPRG